MPVIVIMGVSGTGKSSVGRALAARLGATFIEGDDLHPPANREKMRNGVPLGDADRWPWLAAVSQAARSADEANGVRVVACSALKRSYRAFLRRELGDIALVHLHGDPDLIRRRMGKRDHFMPVALLDSQLADLEAPGGETALRIDIESSVDESVAAIERWYRTRIAR